MAGCGDGPTVPAGLSEYFGPGKVAVITGSSSGIGKATALRCAAFGMKVYMADVDAACLELARAEVQKAARSLEDVIAVVTDVSDVKQVSKLSDVVFANAGFCNFLMNNAGVQLSGCGACGALDAWEKTIAVNTWGPIYGCQAFVPKMRESGLPGLIVNTGSKQGITMPPGNLAYNVSKAALKTYTEGLEHELRSVPERKLRAALLVPGWVNTSLVLKQRAAEAAKAGVDFDISTVPFHEEKPATGAWMPSQMVDFMLAELDAGRFYIIGPDNDVDRETDNLRMTWSMQDITQDRPPLSRWHPDYKDQFAAYVEAHKTK